MKDLDLIAQTTLFSFHKNASSIKEQIHNYLTLSDEPIRFALFTIKKPLKELFTLNTNAEYSVDLSYSNKDIFIVDLTRKYGRKKKNIAIGKALFFPCSDQNDFLVVTQNDGDFFSHALMPFLKKSFQYVIFPFFYSWEMEKMLDNLHKARMDRELQLTQISRKSRIKDRLSRKSKESDLTWTDAPYKEIFRQSRDNDQWIEKVQFDLINQVKSNGFKGGYVQEMSGAMTRNGHFKCQSNFNLFHDYILSTALEIISSKRALLSGKARVKKENYKSKPLYIDFEEPIFKDKEQNRRLSMALKSLPHTVNSILHQNPYLHIVVTDYLDNSNYDIWILSDNRITVLPQTVCSMHSLNRLCDHISKEFREGEIKETID